MQVVEMKIVMNESGEVNVTGPLENKVFCYGLLELAKEAIAQRAAPPAAASRIVPVHGHLRPLPQR